MINATLVPAVHFSIFLEPDDDFSATFIEILEFFPNLRRTQIWIFGNNYGENVQKNEHFAYPRTQKRPEQLAPAAGIRINSILE